MPAALPGVVAGARVTLGVRSAFRRAGAVLALGVTIPPQVAQEMSMSVADHWVTMTCGGGGVGGWWGWAGGLGARGEGGGGALGPKPV